MEGKYNYVILPLVLLNACVFIHSAAPAKGAAPAKEGGGGGGGGGGATIDVSTLGGKPGSDIAPALTKAWKQACESPTASKIVVPNGKYQLSVISFTGPCKAPITLQVSGDFQAPRDIKQFAGKDPTWIKFEWVKQVTFIAGTGGAVFDGNGEAGWTTSGCSESSGLCVTKPYNFRYANVNDTVVDGITSMDSKQFHNMVIGCYNLTMQNVKIIAPGDEQSRNTDGIHVARSTNIKIINTPIKTGDDCISIGDGTKNLTIENVSCGPGHGVSIGSLGKFDNEGPVEGVYIKNCSFTKTDFGIRIKSWLNSKPCSASEIHFEDITMTNVENPIFIDQAYCPSTKCDTSVPSKVKISNVFLKNIKGTGTSPSVMRLVCSRGSPCTNVQVEDVDLKYSGPLGAPVSECCNVKPVSKGKVSPAVCGVTTSEEESSKKITYASKQAEKLAKNGNAIAQSAEAASSELKKPNDRESAADSTKKESSDT